MCSFCLASFSHCVWDSPCWCTSVVHSFFYRWIIFCWMNISLFVYLYFDKNFKCLQVCAITNILNFCVQGFLWTHAFISLGKVPKSGMVRSYGRSIFNFLRNCQIFFQNSCTVLHSYQQYCGISSFSTILQRLDMANHFNFSSFHVLICHLCIFLGGVCWNLSPLFLLGSLFHITEFSGSFICSLYYYFIR